MIGTIRHSESCWTRRKGNHGTEDETHAPFVHWGRRRARCRSGSGARRLCRERQQAVEEKTGATESWDEEFDVVVCGAGIARVAAAVTVATEGDGASCLLLEKEPSPNGNSPFCAGSMLYCEDADAFMTYLDAMIGDSTPDDVKRAFAEELTHNLTWLYDLGAKEEWLEVGPPDDVKLGEWPELPNDNTYGRIKFKTDGDGRSTCSSSSWTPCRAMPTP